MLLLEDKSVISDMNNLSEEEQRQLVLSHAKEEGIEIIYQMIKNRKDKRNFHILTENGVLLQRMEFMSYFEHKKYIIWSTIGTNLKRIQGDFGTVIYEFNKAIV